MTIDRHIHVYSEIGNLKTVMLHRPGNEIENLVPEYLERLLFDDIPYLKVAREEHDAFASILGNNGVEVLYLERLVAEALVTPELKNQFLKEVIAECNITDANLIDTLTKYLLSMPIKGMIDKIMGGVRKKEIGISETYGDYPFVMDPMPNLYFTRDPFACMGSGVTLNTMRTETRNRETIFGKYIFEYHPSFAKNKVNTYYERGQKFAVEGGDELILNKDTLAIGASLRTDFEAIKKIAKNVFEVGESFKTVLVFHIPVSRAMMHLDTVFTMIDYDKFTVHPGIEGSLKVTELTYDKSKKEVIAKEEQGTLQEILSKHLGREITLIRCGGGDTIVAGREQWNDGSNTLAIAPGKVITYERNYITNELLDKHNVSVITMPSAELSRGRGGPRCMSMPFYREDLK